jgi:hypothetical protein
MLSQQELRPSRRAKFLLRKERGRRRSKPDFSGGFPPKKSVFFVCFSPGLFPGGAIFLLVGAQQQEMSDDALPASTSSQPNNNK